MVGPKHVMGLAIGNELELLHNHVPWRAKRFPPVCLSMKFLPVTCPVLFFPFLEKDDHNFCRRWELQVSLSNDFGEAEADAACVAELFSGGRLWSTFVEHVAEFAPWRERRNKTMEIEGCDCKSM